MPLSRSRDYLSIGEVLEAIRPDFPDISISKIRFLEAEGLISPERTESGYRKFFEPDVERLRYILSLQRDHFMPLKVIKERLAGLESNGGDPATDPSGAAPVPEAPPNAAAADPELSLSRSDLRKAAGISDQELAQLEEFGILADPEGGRYDQYDLTIARAARALFRFGVEARHLRMYRQFADREIGFFEQVVSPVASRRTDEGSREASRSVGELVAHTRRLHDALVRTRAGKLL